MMFHLALRAAVQMSVTMQVNDYGFKGSFA